ncbi:MAG: hypothetical protein HGB12_05495, partial [Bacteroidetes bacterium]|nr:hypothetical protein [Bacteroidota bacterium]
MKTKHFIIVLAFLIFSSCCMHRRNHSHTTYSQPVESYSEPIPPPVNFQTFYDDLSPYGYWIYNENGYVWIPEYGPNFSPYHTNGHWVFTNYGWTWVSQYNWGWAPFHYGRWIWDDIYGWEWIPGYDWAPAWVYWGQYNNYYGWAPMPPNAGYGYQPPMNQW